MALVGEHEEVLGFVGNNDLMEKGLGYWVMKNRRCYAVEEK